MNPLTTEQRLGRLGDALQSAAQADLAHAPAAARPARRRPGRRMAALVLAVAVLVPGGAWAASEIWGTDDVALSMPAGTLMLAGTEPTCTVVHDRVEYRCTLARAPVGEIAAGQFKGTVEPTVDTKGIVNGGCRSLNAEGTTWSCYLGRTAVEQKIVGPDFLGQHVEGPGVG